MPKVRVITGTYDSVLDRDLNAYGPQNKQAWLAHSPNPSFEILKDLSRNTFVPSNGRTYDDYLATWLSPSASRSFSQGNMTGSFYLTILQTFIMISDKFPKEEVKEGVVPRTEETRVSTNEKSYYHGDNRDNLSFSFYDDDGVLCGVSIHYSKLDPELWTAAVIRNPTGEPKDREVLILSPEDIIKSKQGDQLDSSQTAVALFYDFLNSKQIQRELDGIFIRDGLVDIEKLKELIPHYKPEREDNETSKVSSLKSQYAKMESWNELTKEQVAIKKAWDEQGELSDEEFTTLKKGLKKWQLDLPDREWPLVDEILQKEHWNELKEKHQDVIKTVLNQKQWKELTSEQVAIVKEALIQKQKQNVVKALGWYESELRPWYHEYELSLHDEAMDKEAEKSFLRRNAGPLTGIVISLLFLVSAILILTGVLAPLGLTLGLITTIVTAVVGGGAAITAGASAIKVGVDENKLSTYQQELEAEQESLSVNANFQRKLKEINPNIDISQFGKGKITIEMLAEVAGNLEVDLPNDSEAVMRAILGANFSEDEFNKLFETVQKAAVVAVEEKPLVIEDDEESSLVVDHEKFVQMQHKVEVVVDDSSLDTAEKAVKGVPTGISSTDVVVTKKKEVEPEGEKLDLSTKLDSSNV
ncbi:Uncharacterised protein [Legionella lansingensis]|uniref:Uncharacterized protein n=1 Tax=Legionella lansingensis TaxID=45067 RepID=A0A0W0VRU0_9GAMM|nr:hypothetical protein [Legionella lansingensis]KTD22792.1 hypothetical protein Llan_1033 [Legionella lansingensis]SNV49807.1 Uncharacterised protein [Legionella lansingensis]